MNTERTPADAAAEVILGADRGGRYRLIRRLDSGGIANVWLAHDVALDVQVAIKLLRGRGKANARDSLARELALRLVHEARVIAAVRHPAIVSVSDVAHDASGEPFVVMELLSGQDLGARLRREGPLTPVEAVGLLLPIVHALALVHEKGIVHRDLKPDNVFLARRDDGSVQPKLLDFGIAKSPAALAVTADGMTIGSPAYMSPEQVRGREADARSDVWSLCMTLYELLTGLLPFERSTNVATHYAILHEALPALPDAVDAVLGAIVLRGLEKFPALRWQSMRELGRELARWLATQGIERDGAGTALSVWQDPSDARDADAFAADTSVPGVPARTLRGSFWFAIAAVIAVGVGVFALRGPRETSARPLDHARVEAVAVPSATPSQAPDTTQPPELIEEKVADPESPTPPATAKPEPEPPVRPAPRSEHVPRERSEALRDEPRADAGASELTPDAAAPELSQPLADEPSASDDAVIE